MELVLVACGLAAVAIGSWRGYANARAVVVPPVHPADAGRTDDEAKTSVAERARVRPVARNLAAAIAWLLIAMYGLFLFAAAETAG